MKLNLLLTPSLLFLVGCATPIEFVQKSPKKQAVVRFVRPPNTSADTDYKADLNNQATKFCDGEYKIKNEHYALSDASTPSDINPTASPLLLTSSENHLAKFDYIEFVCELK